MGVCSASKQLIQVSQLNELSGSRERVMQAIRGHFASTNALLYELAERAIEDDELMPSDKIVAWYEDGVELLILKIKPFLYKLNAYELVRSDGINPITYDCPMVRRLLKEYATVGVKDTLDSPTRWPILKINEQSTPTKYAINLNFVV
uniref:Uncharacterized protein n=1 Tax=Ditylenchus dipsaci TaxID=166011 RepID=A0A915CWV9_9BILA